MNVWSSRKNDRIISSPPFVWLFMPPDSSQWRLDPDSPPPFIISDEEGIGAAFIKIKNNPSIQVLMQPSQRCWRTTWEGCCPHHQETWPHVWDLQFFSFNHIVKHWYPVLHDTLHCLLHHSYSSKEDRKCFFSPPLPLLPFPSAWHPLPSFTDSRATLMKR